MRIKFNTEIQERIASFSWWVFRRYYLPNLMKFTKEDWEDIRQEIYLFAFSTPLIGLPNAGDKKLIYKIIHSTIYRALRNMGYIKPKGKGYFIRDYYIKNTINQKSLGGVE